MSLDVLKKEKNMKSAFDFVKGVFLTHIYYGVNFLIGIMKRPDLELRGYDKKTGNYIGG